MFKGSKKSRTVCKEKIETNVNEVIKKSKQKIIVFHFK